MNNGTSQPSRRASVLTPYSNRTISHPTFMPIYQESLQRWSPATTPVPVMTPLDFYYTDPNLPPGHRVPNIVTKFEAIENFQLNTPSPIMSSQLALPIQPDPFLSGTYPTRNLGTRSWTIDLCHRPHPYLSRPQTKGTLEVIQMSQAEDEAITSLLLLQHSPGTKSQQGKEGRSPSPAVRLMTQSQQSPVRSPPSDACSQEAILAKLERTPEVSSSRAITTAVNEPYSKEHCLSLQGVSPSGLSEYDPELYPGLAETTPELDYRAGLSSSTEVDGDAGPLEPNDPGLEDVALLSDWWEPPVDSPEDSDSVVGVDSPLRPTVEPEWSVCNGHQSDIPKEGSHPDEERPFEVLLDDG